MASVDLSGKWKEYKSENKEAVLKKMGVPDEMIPKWLAFEAVMELTNEGDNKHKMTLLAENDHVIFSNIIEIGVPYKPQPIPGAPDLGEMISTFEEGGIFRSKTTTDDNDYVDDMSLENGELKVVQKCGGEECTAYYKKV